MMPNRMLAKMVVESLEEANPARLIQLAESNQLVNFLANRIQKFHLQFVREMDGKPEQAELTVAEGLYPMLTEFPTAKQKPTLTPQQTTMVEMALDQYEEESYPANRSAQISA